METLQALRRTKVLQSEIRIVNVIGKDGSGIQSFLVSPAQILFDMQGTSQGRRPMKEESMEEIGRNFRGIFF
jgi:hypothetical protein